MRCVVLVAAGGLAVAPLVAQERVVPAAFRDVTTAVAAELSGERARETVAFVEQFFRLPGNPGFDRSIDTVAALLRSAGYVEASRAAPGERLVYRVESRAMPAPAWSPVGASLRIVGESAPLLEWTTNKSMLAINSTSTPAGGVTARVVDVGAGGEAEFTAAGDIAGAVVLGTGNARTLAQRAFRKGAIGVLAVQRLPAYNQPDKNVTAIGFTGIARDTTAQGWVILMHPQATTAMRAALARGPVQVHANVQTQFTDAPELTLVAEVRGSELPEERFVYSAHVQEPGANDNASGVGAQAEMARTAAVLLRNGTIDPARTLTFLWGDEIRSTQRFLAEDSVRQRGVKWGMSLDMVGEDTEKTGGTFLIEKMPDPSAVWVRGEDQHTEWGGRPMRQDEIWPHWFNDFVRQRCLDRAATTGWVVKANPFEGGSDHTPFLRAKIPGLLLWHFTDQFYHTDRDRIEMVSATTLGNVGNCALTTGLLLADGGPAVAAAALQELTRVALRELEVQGKLSRDALAGGATLADERTILAAWRDYYVAAIALIPEMRSGPAGLEAAIAAAQTQVRERADAIIGALTR
jgi:hypothetical protein